MSHRKSRNRRPLWIRELGSDVETLRLNLADPEWPKLEAIGSALRPRIRLAWGIHAVGMALLGVSQRLDWACPADFLEFYEDGFREGRDRGRREVVEILLGPDTMMSDVARLVTDLKMPPEHLVAQLKKPEATR